MAMIKIGDNTYEATLSRQRDMLTVTQMTNKSLEELEQEFSPEVATEIRVSRRDGPTEAIFSNLDILSMQLKKEKETGIRRVTITLRVEQMTQSEADELQEKIAQQEKIIEEQAKLMDQLLKQVENALSSSEAVMQALTAIEEGIQDA